MAMAFMLLDHLWATVIPGHAWMTCVGRIAFPIFAFMIAEGFHYTHNLKKYILRMLVFAVISEIPFNMMYGTQLIYPYHQNVMWTFLIALLCMWAIETVRKKEKPWLTGITALGVTLGGLILGFLAMTDYYGFGVVTVLAFYFFRGKKWWNFIGQFIALYWVNVEMLGGLCYNIEIAGHSFELVQQGFALLALIPIWLYNGRQGHHSKPFQYACYAFYPVHALILGLMMIL